MIAQQAGIGTSQREGLRVVPCTAWHFRLLAVFICVCAGGLSVILGPDNYWDLRYYHLYAPWAYLHDRYLYDIGPAQEEGFLNPTADFLLYGMIFSPLNEWPRVIAFIMGTVHGINAALVSAIACHVLRPLRSLERSTLRTAAVLMGVSGGGFVSLLGTSSNDLTSGLFIMAAVYGVLKVAEPTGRQGAWRGFAASGLLAGVGIGLKYTSAVFIPGFAVIALMAALQRRTVAGVIVFGVAAAAGLFAAAGHHMFTLWNDFGSPVFPYMNHIFRSPFFEPTAIRDARFLPQDFWHLVAFPFYWTTTDTYIVIEPPFRDWRGAIAYVAMAAGFLGWAARMVRRPHRPAGTPAQTRGLAIVFAFMVVSYFAWVVSFAYYRYVVPLEMLTGVVAVGSLIWLFDDRRLRVVAALVLLTLACSMTVYPHFARRPYEAKYVDVTVPPFPANSVVLIATWDPAAYFIPFADPSVQYLGIENNYLQISQDNRFASEVKRIMRTPERPKFIVAIGPSDADRLNGLLGKLGLKLSAQPCQPIRSNLEGKGLSLCRIADG
jgi:hypothetical protein